MGNKKTTNQENTAVDEQDVELRPFPPFLPPQATVLMMGSFPPAQTAGGPAQRPA